MKSSHLWPLHSVWGVTKQCESRVRGGHNHRLWQGTKEGERADSVHHTIIPRAAWSPPEGPLRDTGGLEPIQSELRLKDHPMWIGDYGEDCLPCCVLSKTASPLASSRALRVIQDREARKLLSTKEIKETWQPNAMPKPTNKTSADTSIKDIREWLQKLDRVSVLDNFIRSMLNFLGEIIILWLWERMSLPFLFSLKVK